MSFITLLILIVVIGVIVLIVRSIVRVMRSSQPITGFPVFSISMLSISLALLIVGIFISLQVSDALGGAISSIGGFFGLFESHVRHKREALADKAVKDVSSPEES
jgi:hypothetical protein